MAEDNNIEQEIRELEEIDRIIYGPFRLFKTKKRKHARYLIAKKLSQITTDSLTRLYNKPAFNNELEQEVERAARHRYPISVIMADIDNFKNYNDEYGHPQGDVALKAVADTINRYTRTEDYAARWGGEEFAVILPETEEEDALEAAERLRKKVEEIGTEKDPLPMRPEKEKLENLTVSIGVETHEPELADPKTLVNNADIALYVAKAKGKNRVVAYDPIKHKDIKKVA